MFSLDHRPKAIYQGSAGVFMDAKGNWWLQLSCLRGPAEGEPAAATLDASNLARLMAMTAAERRQPA